MRAGSFATFAPLVLLAGVSLASAQQLPPRPPPPTTQLPPAPAALSVPNPFAGFHPGPRDLYQSPDGSDRFQHLSQYPAPPPPIVPVWGGVYFPGPYYYPGPFDYARGMPGPYYETSLAETYRMTMAETYRRRQREAARGGLVLQAVPDMAQVFVDGSYVGLAEEFGLGGRAINLNAGAHHVELRATGYETLTFSVAIEPNSIVRYRGEMQPIAMKPAAATALPQPTAVKSFYVIPNCYAGDKPPSGTLPKGCDLKKLQTRK
jgi:hypothetical protein